MSRAERQARILVIDDAPMTVELRAVSLRFQGFEVVTAISGTDGLDTVRRFQPDPLIVDVMMPGHGRQQPQRPITLEVRPGAGTMDVNGDEARLRQVLADLLGNALAHTPATAAITPCGSPRPRMTCASMSSTPAPA